MAGTNGSTKTKVKKRWVIAKQGKFATVAGGLGTKPKVYNTMREAQYDVDSNPKFKGGIVQAYGGADAAPPAAAPHAAAAGLPAATGGAKPRPKAKPRPARAKQAVDGE
jgi:hypothetical protein